MSLDIEENDTNFTGHLNPDRHRTCGHRAWCDCGTWCTWSLPCHCCRENLSDQHPCPTCGGSGIAPREAP